MENKELKKHNHRKITGVVVSDKMAKTIVISVDRLKEHPRYKKRIKVSSRFKAHDDQNQAKMGDLVAIEETRPISKDKKWKLVEILKKAVTEKPESVNENSEMGS